MLFLHTMPFLASSISTLDIVLGIVLAFGLIRGFMRGLIIEITSLIALVLGIYGAIHFSFYAIDLLTDYFSWQPQTITIAAFILTFIIIVLAVLLLGKLITKLANIMALGLLNRFLGGLFGLLKMGVILSVLLMFLSAFSIQGFLVDQKTISTSVLYKPIKSLGEKILPSVLEEINKHRDTAPSTPQPQETTPQKNESHS